MKATIIFLSGIAAAATGAFIRSCMMGAQALDFSAAWCGPAMASAQPHAHCAGCALLVAGLVVAATSPFFGSRPLAAKDCC